MTTAAHYASHLQTVLDRYQKAMASSGFDQVVVHSGIPKVAFQDDYHYPFKPNPNFVQLLPLTMPPHCLVVIKPEQKPVLIFLQPRDYWHVVPEDPSGYWVEHFDIRVIRTPSEAKALLNLQPKTAFIGEDTDAFTGWGFHAFNPVPLLAPLHWQRGYKTPYEIDSIAEANRVAARAHNAARDAFLAGKSELDIHHAYVAATGLQESQLPYGNIIALNEHGAVLHYTELQNNAPKDSRSFLIDAGAISNGYASDITRTYSREKNAFAELIQAVDDMQLKRIAAIKPGQQYLDVHLAFHHDIAEILKRFELVNMSAEAMVESGVTATFFPHGIGHLLGIQVHDIGGRFLNDKGENNPPPSAHPYLRMTRKVEQDMVFTIEPGIYFINMLLEELQQKPEAKQINWQNVEQFKPFGGVRIEDNVLVTKDGHRNLSREAFDAL
ncbi:Xaa-Pro dipeptidase [Permianibacter aggregans]|uniref:Xaa-Pro dipeptidase n=1 Tax=Permianibacter aggregans TaxID=1510150 RepID=A0A4R6UQB3_9GAMM|nr:Xaa-Pro dipeptidase [Permianibacter aggregans]QGX40183.1 Xaa-Pro dipeptidase [Permianibacter aggregans]TDQ47435.1 Xaa-Pro dipeptidase [Permianibacter aggregans]